MRLSLNLRYFSLKVFTFSKQCNLGKIFNHRSTPFRTSSTLMSSQLFGIIHRLMFLISFLGRLMLLT